MKYPRQLSSGANNIVLALNQNEVAKLYLENTRSDLGSEAEKMKYANKVNGLVCRFIRLDFDESLKAEMLVMERIYPMGPRLRGGKAAALVRCFPGRTGAAS